MSEAPVSVELLQAPASAASPVVLTCEHASVELPEPYTWPAADRWLVGTHWSYDLGVAELVREIHRRSGWPAVLARFSRLLADPNRPEGHPDLFRRAAEGRVIALNQDLSAAEMERRLARMHRPYHQAVQDLVAAHPGATIVSFHSFTPLYEGTPRTVQIGVLFDADEALARAVAADLAAHGPDVRLNEPWSGKEGLIYAPDRHAREQGRQTIELELRQDLLADPAWMHAAAGWLVESLSRRVGET